MTAEFHFEHGSVQVDLDRGIDLSDPFTDHGNGPLAWGIDHPKFSPVRAGDFVGSVAEGGSVNFRDLFLNPHGNGTHTECLGHITERPYSVNRKWEASFHVATLIEVEPAVLEEAEAPREKGDHLFLRQQFEEKLEGKRPDISALIVRTHPYPGTRPRNYSGNDPPYFHPDAIGYLRERGIRHLLTDLPSVDKENDGGMLPAHHAFWNVPEDPDHERTISELIRVPEGTEEGNYLLELQVAPVENDAAPSRPVIHPIIG
jgi:arylformamidase